MMQDQQPRTGWPPGMLQDDSRELSGWLATRPGARLQVNRTIAEIEARRAEAERQLKPLTDAWEVALFIAMHNFTRHHLRTEEWRYRKIRSAGGFDHPTGPGGHMG